MADKIKTGTILIEEGPFLPESLRFESEPCLNGWRLVKNLDGCGLDRRIRHFRFIREEDVSGQRCYVLELLPRRKDKNLLRGDIWVDANTYLLRRTEAEPAKKTPSWWLRDVRIALLYGDVGGMWLQTASEATAKVRILGQYTMVSRDVKYKISELVAAGSSAQTSF